MRVLALLVLAGCPDRTVSAVPPVPAAVETKTIPVEADLDLLFVIDNSASTGDKQQLFAQNFPRFTAAIDAAFATGRPNLHLGVVSTTVGTGSDVSFGTSCPKVATADDGRLHATCSTCTINGNFLSDIAAAGGGRTTNFGCTLDTALSCIAELGALGCGFEAPLEAMKRALDGSRAENAGFLRDGAYLAVVVLTDEDDCSVRDPALFSLNNVGPGDFRCQPLYAYQCDQAISATAGGSYTGCKPATGSYLQDTSAYFDFLTSLKPNQVSVAVIGGVDGSGRAPDPSGFAITTGPVMIPGAAQPQPLALEPQCSTTINGNPAIARPGLRLADFTSQFGSRGRYYSVCQSDYSAALSDLGRQIATDISPCLEGELDPTDTDPQNPGVQLQCTVSDVQNPGSSGQTETEIFPCQMAAPDMPAPGGARPCWWVGVDATTCPTTPTHLIFHIERAGAAPPGTFEVVSCAAFAP